MHPVNEKARLTKQALISDAISRKSNERRAAVMYPKLARPCGFRRITWSRCVHAKKQKQAAQTDLDAFNEPAV